MQKFLHLLALSIPAAIGYCLLVLQPYPILHDLPEWMYQGWLFRALLSGDAAVAANFELVAYPVPNSISQVGMGLLNFVLPPVLAGKVWLGLYLIAASVLWLFICRRLQAGAGGIMHLLLTVLITLGPGFWNGYINFQIGLLLFALYLFLTVTGRLQNSVWLFIFSLLIFFSHAAVFAVFVLVNLLFFIFSVRRRYGVDSAALLPSLLLLAWYAVNKLSGAEGYVSQAMGASKWVQYKAYTLAKQGPFHNFIQHDGKSSLESFDLLYQLGFLVNFVVAVFFIAWFAGLCFALIRGQLPSLFRADNSRLLWPVTLCIGVVLLGFLLGGSNSFGVVNPGERLLIVGLLMALLFYRPPCLVSGGLTICCIVFSFYTIVATYSLSRDPLEAYSVARSAGSEDLQQYVGDIYANSRHKHFNHRLYIYADRGIELTHDVPALLPVDLETSVVKNR